MIKIKHLLKESPDHLKVGNKVLNASSPNARPFTILKTGEVYKGERGTYHKDSIDPFIRDDGFKVGKDTFLGMGRYWTRDDIISVWYHTMTPTMRSKLNDVVNGFSNHYILNWLDFDSSKPDANYYCLLTDFIKRGKSHDRWIHTDVWFEEFGYDTITVDLFKDALRDPAKKSKFVRL